MYLRRLELRGFKTFATYTDFLFDEGVTAIVGPNGSGKSNIADAVRWVLGEQSYSALRGKRTEDMVFAGTRRRAPLGMAEAIVTFDNASGWLPIDFGEVTVSRRAYRSGENQYLINGSRVRLRDVVELIGKAGLGRQGFVTIGQGVVDAALSLRPEERRALFEEAAGIRIYQDKRTEALNKLAETQQNLTRLTDILHEIAPRLRDLEKQSQRAEEHELLSQDLEKLLRLWYGYRWWRLQESLSEAEAGLHNRLADVELSRARLHEVEALLTDTQAQQSDLRRQLSAWHLQSGELHAQAETVGRELAVSGERSNLLQQRRSELRAESATLAERRTAVSEGLIAAQSERQRVQEAQQAASGRLDALRGQWQRAEAARGSAERAVESERDAAYRLATALAEVRNRSKQLTDRRAQVQAQREKEQAGLTALQDQAPALEGQLSGLAGMAEQLKRQQEATLARQDELQQRSATLEKSWQQRREEASKALRELQRLQDRQDMLSGLRQALAGYAPGVKAVLDARQRLSGIVGPVASLLHVPQKLERALEAALGSYAQALVVERWDDASAAIAELRVKKAGWATFLPLDSLSAPRAQAAPGEAGVLGTAQSLVRYEERFEPVARLLLGRVVVVEDLDTARRVRSKLASGQRLVTLSGEVVQASGVISGGSGRREGSLLAQEREWRELPEQLAKAQGAEGAVRSAVAEVEGQQQACRQELKAAAQELARLATQAQEAARNQAALQSQLERLRQEAEWRQRLDEQQVRELATLDEKAAELSSEAQKRAQEHDARKAQVDGALTALEAARQAETSARQELSEAETSLAVAQRQLKVQEQFLSSQEGNLSRLEQEIEAKAARLAEADREATELETRLEKWQSQAETLGRQIAEAAEQIGPAEAEVLTLGRQAQNLERTVSQARQRLSEVDLLYSQQVLEKERRNDALVSLEQRIEEELGDIEYPSEQVRQLRMDLFRRDREVLPELEVLPENTQADIKSLKARLRRLGSINPNAPQEFHEVKERHDFLQAQMADLEESSASLREVIRELDLVMEKEFMALFQVAAKEFKRYFEVLFNGGEARLTLTEPESPATTGVDIFARPPGKRPQTLALLSGGERALTATALLFAVLKARPLPFCVLDEVDAMLDEANVGRFRSLLQEFAQQTQFIVITHNRQTVEAARTIYGVSMAEEGVSKVVSLKLEREPALAQEHA
jgi:chromosome segregation protein